MATQTLLAIDEADVIIFLVDGRQGATYKRYGDSESAAAVNVLCTRSEQNQGMNKAVVSAEFYELGLGDPLSISSAHGEGVKDIIELALEHFQEGRRRASEIENLGDRVPKVAIVGRPNVGKSALVNALMGEERVIAFDQPGHNPRFNFN